MSIISTSSNEMYGTSEGIIKMMRADVYQICQILYDKSNYILNSCNV